MPLPDEPASAAGSSARHKKWSKAAGGTPCLLPDRGSEHVKLAKRDTGLRSTQNSSDGWARKEFPALAASCRNGQPGPIGPPKQRTSPDDSGRSMTAAECRQNIHFLWRPRCNEPAQRRSLHAPAWMYPVWRAGAKTCPKRQPAPGSRLAATGTAPRSRSAGVGWNRACLSLKHVTLAPQCANQRLLRAMIELAAETGDIDFDHIAELLPVVVIEMLQQFGFRDDGARTMREILKHPVFHGSQRNWPPGALHAAIYGVQLQVPDSQDRRRLAFAATDERLSAGQQFAEIEWFSQIIICSGVEQGYDGLLVVPGG